MAHEYPSLVVCGPAATGETIEGLQADQMEVLAIDSAKPVEQIVQLLQELGRRRMTNVLVEGGASVLGACFDAGVVDEVHAFMAPKIVGGREALSPVGGDGVPVMESARRLKHVRSELLGEDIHMWGRLE